MVSIPSVSSRPSGRSSGRKVVERRADGDAGDRDGEGEAGGLLEDEMRLRPEVGAQEPQRLRPGGEAQQ